MGVSINDNNGGGSVTQTTNTSSSSLNCQSHSNHDGHDHSNNSNNYYDQNNNGCGRKSCMNQSNFNAAFLGASNSIGGIADGQSLKGNLCTIKFRAINPSQLVTLEIVKVISINSNLNSK